METDYEGNGVCACSNFSVMKAGLKYLVPLAVILGILATYEVAFGVYCDDLGELNATTWDSTTIDVSDCGFSPDTGTAYSVAVARRPDASCGGYDGNVYLSGDPGYVTYTKPDNIADWVTWSQATDSEGETEGGSYCLEIRGNGGSYTWYQYSFTTSYSTPTPTPTPTPSETVLPVSVLGDCQYFYASGSSALASSSCDYDVSAISGHLSVLSMSLMVGLFVFALSVGHHILSHV